MAKASIKSKLKQEPGQGGRHGSESKSKTKPKPGKSSNAAFSVRKESEGTGTGSEKKTKGGVRDRGVGRKGSTVKPSGKPEESEKMEQEILRSDAALKIPAQKRKHNTKKRNSDSKPAKAKFAKVSKQTEGARGQKLNNRARKNLKTDQTTSNTAPDERKSDQNQGIKAADLDMKDDEADSTSRGPEAGYYWDAADNLVEVTSANIAERVEGGKLLGERKPLGEPRDWLRAAHQKCHGRGEVNF